MTPAQQLGPYRLIECIGRGGMGEVWKARDTRLDREVAIKISTEQFSDRFEREARAIAALNHPNICTLFDVGPNYLVMELIDGPTLADCIAEGPILLEEALAIAHQIADALEAAHDKNIVHRDLKPANIKLRHDGSVKVLDFGLAKAGGPETVVTGDSPTMLHTPTQMGVILGTAAYMAPEQARGKNIDKRVDIWAFGVVLCETVTGKRVFEGEDLTETLASVVKSDPDLTPVPQKLRRLIAKCLQKDPKKRLRDIGDAWELLDSDRQTTAVAATPPTRPVFAWVIAALAILAAGALAVIRFRETPPAEPILNASIPVPEDATPEFLSLSPDGRRLAVSLMTESKLHLYLRSLDSPQFHLLVNTEGARASFWSPDGKSIGFFADGKLKVIPAAGGPPQTLCDATATSGGTWNRNGWILFTEHGSISRVPASGGACTPVTKAEPGEVDDAPAFLPDGRHFLYTVGGSAVAESKRGVFLASLDDPRGRRILADPADVVYVPPRPGSPWAHLLFLRDSALTAQPFDERSLQAAGDPFAVAEPVSHTPNLTQPAVSVSPDGLLVYIANLSLLNARMVWLDRSGKELAQVGSPGPQRDPALSPDGKTVALTREPEGQPAASLWLRDIVRDSESKFAEPGSVAVWSPDSRRIVYRKGNDLYMRDAGGGGGETPILANGNLKIPADWSRDGRFLLYTEQAPKTDIWYLENPLGKPGAPVRLPDSKARFRSQAQLSPDGHWLAYTSDESGAYEVYIRPFPAGSGQWKVSTGGGVEPRWSKDGKEIFFLHNDNAVSGTMMAASIRPGVGALDVGVPTKLFQYRSTATVPVLNMFRYSVAADGRFLMNISIENSPPAIQMIANWQKLGPK